MDDLQQSRDDADVDADDGHHGLLESRDEVLLGLTYLKFEFDFDLDDSMPAQMTSSLTG